MGNLKKEILNSLTVKMIIHRGIKLVLSKRILQKIKTRDFPCSILQNIIKLTNNWNCVWCTIKVHYDTNSLKYDSLLLLWKEKNIKGD